MNLPNTVTLARILIIPVFVALFLYLPAEANIPAGLVFLLAALSDVLDGYLARTRKEVTRFGQLVDPIADKLLITSALLCLIQLGLISSWPALIIIAREFAVSGLRILAAAGGKVIPASPWGKFKTISQVAAVLAFILRISWAPGLMNLAIVITALSGVDYFLKAQDVLKRSME